MSRVAYIHPRNSGFSGNKIGLDGNEIWLVPEKIITRFQQGVVRVDEVADGVGEAPLIFYGNRDVVGTVRVSGQYGTGNRHTRNALAKLCSLNPIEGVTLALDAGITYYGNLLVLSDQSQWGSTGKDGAFCDFDVVFQFSGRIIGDGSNGSFDSGSSQLVYTNLKEVTNAASMAYTRSYIDQREDRAVEPYIVVGIPETGASPLAAAEAAVVAEMGGANHFWRGNSTLPFHMITSRWAGVNIIVGELIYDRAATDCRAYSYQSDIGFIVKGSEGEVVTGDSGSDVDNVCADLASGPFAARFVHWRSRSVPYVIHLLPCVWSSNPRTDSNLREMVATINSNAVTIEGVSIAATELRFDGVQNLTKYTANGTSKYMGYLKFSELEGGWTDGTLRCARLVPLPLEGNQTVPSYTVEASIVQLFDYDRRTFSSIASLCSACYS